MERIDPSPRPFGEHSAPPHGLTAEWRAIAVRPGFATAGMAWRSEPLWEGTFYAQLPQFEKLCRNDELLVIAWVWGEWTDLGAGYLMLQLVAQGDTSPSYTPALDRRAPETHAKSWCAALLTEYGARALKADLYDDPAVDTEHREANVMFGVMESDHFSPDHVALDPAAALTSLNHVCWINPGCHGWDADIIGPKKLIDRVLRHLATPEPNSPEA